MSMNQFRLFQDPSSNVSSETVMMSNNKRIDHIVRTFLEEFFPKMVNKKYTAGRLGSDAQPDNVNDEVIVVDDDNDGGEVIKRIGERLGRRLLLPITRVELQYHKPTVPLKVRIENPEQTNEGLFVDLLPQNIPNDIKAHYDEVEDLLEPIIEREHLRPTDDNRPLLRLVHIPWNHYAEPLFSTRTLSCGLRT